MTQTLRISFETRFNKDSCLRRLATKIATLEETVAQAAGLFDLQDSVAYPFNFLVNGSDDAFKPVWTRQQGSNRLKLRDLAAWKFSEARAFDAKTSRFGFNNAFKGSRGLSLLFDPLIDSFIELSRTSPMRKSFVIVLTDFYPFCLCCSDMVTGTDWGSEQTRGYLNREGERDPTLDPIVSVLSESFRLQRCESGLRKFQGAGIFIWNFFPFFRAGSEHSEGTGLPKSAKWFATAWEWLNAFLECVDAHTVLFASSSWIFPHHKDSNDCLKDLYGKNLDEFRWNWEGWKKQDVNLISKDLFQKPSCARIFRIHHPASWSRQRKREGQKPMPEIFKNLLEQWRSETARPF